MHQKVFHPNHVESYTSLSCPSSRVFYTSRMGGLVLLTDHYKVGVQVASKLELHFFVLVPISLYLPIDKDFK